MLLLREIHKLSSSDRLWGVDRKQTNGKAKRRSGEAEAKQENNTKPRQASQAKGKQSEERGHI